MSISTNIENELNNTNQYDDNFKMDYARIYVKSHGKLSEEQKQENMHSLRYFSHHFPKIPNYHERS